MRKVVVAVVLCLPALAWSQAGNPAAAYPSKPIRIIVPYAPGGITDRLARMVGQKMTAAWGGQPVVIENRPGAATNLGSELVAKAPPDGYTLLWAGIANTVGPALYKNLPYDPLRDFAWVTNMAKVPVLIVSHPSLPAKSGRDLIELAKRRPGVLAFGTAGIGTSGHLAGELFNAMAGVRMTHVPYKGSSQALIDTLSGQVPLYFGAMASPMQHVKTGRVHAIAVTTLKRSAALPDVPTLDEQGLKGFETATWYGVAAPAGTPKEIVTKLNAEIVRIIKLPDVRHDLASEGAEFVGDTPEELTAFVKQEIEKWAKVVKLSGLKAE
jgi:tripartite-type tricarboxylate transporter receptor subunit TctC